MADDAAEVQILVYLIRHFVIGMERIIRKEIG